MINPFAFKASNKEDNVNSWINFELRGAPLFLSQILGSLLRLIILPWLFIRTYVQKNNVELFRFDLKAFCLISERSTSARALDRPFPSQTLCIKSTIALYAKYIGIYNTYRKAEWEVSCRVIFNYSCCKVSECHHSPILLPASVYSMHLSATLALDLSSI